MFEALNDGYAEYLHTSGILATDPGVQVRFPVLPYFLRSNWSGTRSTHPREYN
jgi:hypothetical protein